MNEREIIVIGNTGEVGRSIQSLLTAQGYTVKGISTRDCNLLEPDSVDYLKSYINKDSIILFLSTISRLRYENIASYFNNLTLVKNLTQALEDTSCKHLIFFSSIDVYGRPPISPLISSTLEVMPTGYYGLSKQHSEEFLKLSLIKDKLSIVRLPGIYNFTESDKSPLGEIFTQVLAGEDVYLTGDGSHRRSYLHVEELVNYLVSIIDEEWRGVCHLSSKANYSLKEYVELMIKVTNSKSLVKYSEANGTEYDIQVNTSENVRKPLRECCLDFEDIVMNSFKQRRAS